MMWPLVAMGLLAGGVGAWRVASPRHESGIATAAAKPAPDATTRSVTSPEARIDPSSSVDEPGGGQSAPEELRAPPEKSEVSVKKRRPVHGVPSSSASGAPAPPANVVAGPETSSAPALANETKEAPSRAEPLPDEKRREPPASPSREPASPESLGFANPFKHDLRRVEPW
jgi:hypothetical protein